ncbi:hypothetical protein [Nostoc sp.]
MVKPGISIPLIVRILLRAIGRLVCGRFASGLVVRYRLKDYG